MFILWFQPKTATHWSCKMLPTSQPQLHVCLASQNFARSTLKLETCICLLCMKISKNMNKVESSVTLKTLGGKYWMGAMMVLQKYIIQIKFNSLLFSSHLITTRSCVLFSTAFYDSLLAVLSGYWRHLLYQELPQNWF